MAYDFLLERGMETLNLKDQELKPGRLASGANSGLTQRRERGTGTFSRLSISEVKHERLAITLFLPNFSLATENSTIF